MRGLLAVWAPHRSTIFEWDRSQRCGIRLRRRAGGNCGFLAELTGFLANDVPALRTDLRSQAYATRTPGALRPSGERQCEADWAEQDSDTKPQASISTSVASDDCSADTEEHPD
jgi:hypothetical protein